MPLICITVVGLGAPPNRIPEGRYINFLFEWMIEVFLQWCFINVRLQLLQQYETKIYKKNYVIVIFWNRQQILESHKTAYIENCNEIEERKKDERRKLGLLQTTLAELHIEMKQAGYCSSVSNYKFMTNLESYSWTLSPQSESGAL